MSQPRPGIPVARRTLDAMVRVWYRVPPPFEPHVVSMDVHLRGGGGGGQEELERILKDLIPKGAELRGYELLA